MPFQIKLSQAEIDIICDALRHIQEEAARNIRVWNRVMFACFGEKNDSPEAAQSINIFNERQKLLKKLVEAASNDFRKRLQLDDLKLWEELSLKKRGLALDEDEEKNEEEAGRLIVTDAAIWHKKEDK